tara:strand:- start:557 stop:1297 length:741 start_codon:yes stop_codon:yes gene_type:complete
MESAKIHFISYATNEFSSRANVLENVCKSSNLISSCSIFNDRNLSNEFKQRYSYILSYPFKNAGCWLWKPEIIKNTLNSLNDGDIVIYADAGCTLNLVPESLDNFSKYINICNKHSMLRFQLNHPEWKYTNTKTIKFFKDNYNLKKEHVLSGQLMGTVMLVKVNDETKSYFNTFFDIINDDYDLITNEYDNISPSNGFIQHRHDQSIMSLLSKTTQLGYIIPDETWFDGDFDKRYPFWATRLKGNE